MKKTITKLDVIAKLIQFGNNPDQAAKNTELYFDLAIQRGGTTVRQVAKDVAGFAA